MPVRQDAARARHARLPGHPTAAAAGRAGPDAGGERRRDRRTAASADERTHDGGDVGDVVEPAVAGSGEPVADLFAGGGVDRRSAGPGGEVVAVGEPGYVADVG